MAVVKIPSEQTVLTEPEEVTAFLGRYGIEYSGGRPIVRSARRPPATTSCRRIATTSTH